MSDYGVEIYAENKRRLFTSHQRILKLQGFRVIRGSGGQKIELKQYQRPFFMASPINTNIVAGRIIELRFDSNSQHVIFSSPNDQEYILYYGTY